MNKEIVRTKEANTVYNRRTLDSDYRTLKSILKPGMKVLDIGCGTGAISRDIAEFIGNNGHVIGIDRTASAIENGKQVYGDVPNLTLKAVDLFDFYSDEKFDLIVGARVLQWLSTPKEALVKIKSLLKDGGQVSILDYNHNRLEWVPQPPISMQRFYKAFLLWRKEAGMNNAIGSDLPHLLEEVGFKNVHSINAQEDYTRNRSDFEDRLNIWSHVADLKQIIEEGYFSEKDRIKAKETYEEWVKTAAVSMSMKLFDVRGTFTSK
ncbi:class I SAM-dependent methyltransferase [Flammeovirga pectinis]|uniref:Class I SAM-dependent methyltransferase n=1 Tax=Flammeovirga pectinis TaxID=2494373 RepID=A0A3Q9FL97_9BACT|nr:class I SAM-dependent methyltransferase [Flammeovirga pectinis]AZQ60816.1 class I SAM-dependent methyltransferase [Flammeovirga pectinis]